MVHISYCATGQVGIEAIANSRAKLASSSKPAQMVSHSIETVQGSSKDAEERRSATKNVFSKEPVSEGEVKLIRDETDEGR